MMSRMSEVRAATPAPERLLAIIELQNAIAAAAMSSDDVMRVCAERALVLTGANGAVVGIVEGDDIVCKAVAGSTESAYHLRLPKAWSLAGRCIQERRPLRADNAATDVRVDPEARTRSGAGSMLVVPLLYGEHAVGVLEVMSHKVAAFTDEDAGTLKLLADVVAIALHRAYTYPRPRLDSMHDAVSGLANRRAFEERVQAELNRNRRYGHSFSLALLKLVGLETASDRLGQAAADEILRGVARIVEQTSRVIDGCFRLAADEIGIVMPGTTLEGAAVLVDRFKTRIAETTPGSGLVTPSFGVVEAADETPQELTARAIAVRDADPRR
jgi:diguanylate cyclase (GGDEF)-like protein